MIRWRWLLAPRLCSGARWADGQTPAAPGQARAQVATAWGGGQLMWGSVGVLLLLGGVVFLHCFCGQLHGGPAGRRPAAPGQARARACGAGRAVRRAARRLRVSLERAGCDSGNRGALLAVSELWDRRSYSSHHLPTGYSPARGVVQAVVFMTSSTTLPAHTEPRQAAKQPGRAYETERARQTSCTYTPTSLRYAMHTAAPAACVQGRPLPAAQPASPSARWHPSHSGPARRGTRRCGSLRQRATRHPRRGLARRGAGRLPGRRGCAPRAARCRRPQGAHRRARRRRGACKTRRRSAGHAQGGVRRRRMRERQRLQQPRVQRRQRGHAGQLRGVRRAGGGGSCGGRARPGGQRGRGRRQAQHALQRRQVAERLRAHARALTHRLRSRQARSRASGPASDGRAGWRQRMLLLRRLDPALFREACRPARYAQRA